MTDAVVQVAEVKHKLYTHTGTSPEHMRVLLRSGGTVICELADDSRPLGYYSPEHGMDLHVVDEVSVRPLRRCRAGCAHAH